MFNSLINYKQVMSATNDQSRKQVYERNKIMTLIGSLLIQFSAGIIPIWGNANIYFLSYFKNAGQHVDKDTNSWILISTVLPMCVFIVFSTKLSNRFGFVNVIKACALTFFVSHLVIYFTFNIVVCTIFLLIIPITASSISFIPLYNCLWSYYLQKKSTVTGYAVVSYGIGGVVFNVMFLYMINPDNIQAKRNDNGFVYFDEQVSDNLLFTTKIIYFIVSVFFIAGAMLVHREQENTENNENNYKINSQGQRHYELKQQAQSNKQKVPVSQQNKRNQQQMLEYKDGSPCQILSANSSSSQDSSEFRLRKYLFSWQFIIIFCNVLLIDLYISFLLSNFKLIYLQKVNDDHFLGYCLVVNTVTALAGTFFWGHLGDYLKIGKTMLVVIVVDFAIKLFGVFAYQKETLLVLMFFIGFTSRGMSTVTGPGLIQVFGLKIATQLLPIKALAVIGSFLLIPILQVIFLSFLTPSKFMTILVSINLFLLISTTYFIRHHNPAPDNQTKQLKERS